MLIAPAAASAAVVRIGLGPFETPFEPARETADITVFFSAAFNRSRGSGAGNSVRDGPIHHICGAGGIRTHTGRILSPVPLPLGYGPASALAAAPLRTKSDAEILAQPSDMARGLNGVLGLFDIPVSADYERRPDDAD